MSTFAATDSATLHIDQRIMAELLPMLPFVSISKGQATPNEI